MLAADGCSGSGDKKSPTTPSSSSSSTTVTQVRVSGTTTLTARGQTTQLSATATLSDGSTRSVTQDADWTTSNTSVATVSGGLVTARDVGDADIGATYRGATGTARVQVRYCSLSFGSTGCGGMGVSVQIDASTFAKQLSAQGECRCYKVYVADGSKSWTDFPYLCEVSTRVCFGACGGGLTSWSTQLSRLPVLPNGVVILRPEVQRVSTCGYWSWKNLNMGQCLTNVSYGGGCG
jgi:hypothetical protein